MMAKKINKDKEIEEKEVVVVEKKPDTSEVPYVAEPVVKRRKRFLTCEGG